MACGLATADPTRHEDELVQDGQTETGDLAAIALVKACAAIRGAQAVCGHGQEEQVVEKGERHEQGSGSSNHRTAEGGQTGGCGALVRAWGRGSVVAVLLTLSLALLGEGAPGDLDPTFGVGGKVTTDFGGYDSANALVLQPDGKLVAAGVRSTSDLDFALARYLPDGSLDPTFGVGGKVTTDFGSSDVASALVLQPDGKLVAAGGVQFDGPGDFALARYLPDGSLDPTFGVGGKVTTDFGGIDGASALVLQPDGKLVAAGSSDALRLCPGALSARWQPGSHLRRRGQGDHRLRKR